MSPEPWFQDRAARKEVVMEIRLESYCTLIFAGSASNGDIVSNLKIDEDGEGKTSYR